MAANIMKVKVGMCTLLIVDLRHLKLTVLNSFVLTMLMRNFSSSSVW